MSTTPDGPTPVEDPVVPLETLEEASLEEELTLDAPAPAPGLAAALGIELFGTFVLVLVGVGVGMYATVTNVGPLGGALAFGLTLMVLVAAFGRVSGGHFNPAVTLGAALAGRSRWTALVPYWLAQVVGGALATLVLYVVASSNPQITSETSRQLFSAAANTFGSGSSLQFGILGALLLETVATGVFVAVVLAVTDREAPPTLAAPAIGLALGVGLLLLVPVTGGSMNPARSLAAAIFAGSGALGQVWLFWLAPLLGAAIAGLVHSLVRPQPLELEG